MTKGRRCQRLFLIDFRYKEDVEDKEEEEPEPDCEVAEISLCTITETAAPQIKRLTKVDGCSLVELLDTRSSHNFFNGAWVSRFRLKTGEGP